MVDAERRRSLGYFLRACRERLQPADVGIQTRSTRRRGKGLRREEVAALAGVSVTWYTWIEQGRDISASMDVLENIAAALKLDSAQREYLHSLAGNHAPPGPASDPVRIGREIQVVLDDFGTSPAFLLGHQLDILASNMAARLVFIDEESLPEIERNLAWQMFCNPESQILIVDWERNARGVLAMLRSNWAHHPGDANFTTLIERLEQTSPTFRDLWMQHDVSAKPLDLKELNHRIAGHLAFRQFAFQPVGFPDLTLVVNSPYPDSGTVEKVMHLLDRASVAT